MHRFLLLFYSLCLHLAVLLYLPVLLWKKVAGRKWSPILARLGNAPTLADKRPVWVHAVSVGEVNAVKPLVDALVHDNRAVVVTTTTATGQQVARGHFPDLAVFYFPIDFRWACRLALNAAQPAAVLLAETELWPNFLFEASRQKVPVALVNARLSDSSYRGYRRIGFLLKPLLAKLAVACAQTEREGKRLEDLGVPPCKITVTGNLKYDAAPADLPDTSALRERVSEVLGTGANPVWLWGSTREGEESQLLAVHLEARKRWPDLRLIAAPRHPHRAREVFRLLEAASLRVVRRSAIEAADVNGTDALVLDTVGELAGIFSLADLVFMGGSLVNRGGQNPVEPAVAGRAVIFGPHMQNFRDIAQTLVEADAARQVGDVASLQQTVLELLADEAARQRLGRRARETVARNRGAVSRCRQEVTRLLRSPR